MNFCGYDPTDLVNGEGVRCTLWVSGCSHKCRGCFNQKAWSYTYGSVFDQTMMDKILHDLSRPFIKGISIMGGEPLDPENLPCVIDILRQVRERYGEDKDVMVWTGYKFEDVPAEVKELVDKIMDGKYEHENPTIKKFRGSDNQRLWVKNIKIWEVD